VVHACTDPSAALAEIPAILKGDLSVLPTSKHGSNIDRPLQHRRKPRAVCCGGAITDENVRDIKSATGPDADVVWVRVEREEIQAMGGIDKATGAPKPELLAEYFKGKLKMAGL